MSEGGTRSRIMSEGGTRSRTCSESSDVGEATGPLKTTGTSYDLDGKFSFTKVNSIHWILPLFKNMYCTNEHNPWNVFVDHEARPVEPIVDRCGGQWTNLFLRHLRYEACPSRVVWYRWEQVQGSNWMVWSVQGKVKPGCLSNPYFTEKIKSKNYALKLQRVDTNFDLIKPLVPWKHFDILAFTVCFNLNWHLSVLKYIFNL